MIRFTLRAKDSGVIRAPGSDIHPWCTPSRCRESFDAHAVVNRNVLNPGGFAAGVDDWLKVREHFFPAAVRAGWRHDSDDNHREERNNNHHYCYGWPIESHS
jgi:hypothetical protein